MTTPPFAAILEAARTRHGAAALESRLPQPKTQAELKAPPDGRYRSQMSPAFEEVFHRFDPRQVRAMPDEALEALLGDARLIRRWGS